MTNKDNGGPAFPAQPTQHIAPGVTIESNNGMTLRDYFAAHTTVELEGYGVGYAEEVVGRKMPDFATDPLANAKFWAEFRARMRFIEADAMIRARGAA